MAFVFYDTETTGTNTSFDQILQFAAIKTDDDLKEIERFEIRCRLLSHVVPSPGAMVVTGATVASMTDAALPSHYEMVRKIREKLTEWSPAIFFGYNSIDFDEHLVRQALFQTLHDPYLTNKNGNCRGDILRCARAANLFAPGTLVIPQDEKGKQFFKLDKLAPLNGFAHENAHDALADVEATIHIARLLRDRVPELWSSLLRFTNKTAAIDYLKDEPILALNETYFGNSFTYYITFLGQHLARPGIHAVFDLSVDPDELMSINDVALVARLEKRPKPIRSLRVNAHPVFIPLEIARTIFLPEVSEDELLRRSERISTDANLRKRLLDAWGQSAKLTYPSPHVEEQIYDGFMSRDDEAVVNEFHTLPWEKRLPLIGRLKDPRLHRIAHRLFYNERRDLLPDDILTSLETEVAERMLSLTVEDKWNTLPKALKEVEKMLKEHKDDVPNLLDLKSFLGSLKDTMSQILFNRV